MFKKIRNLFHDKDWLKTRVFLSLSLTILLTSCAPAKPIQGLYYCDLGDDIHALFEFSTNGNVDVYTDEYYTYVDTLSYEIKGSKYTFTTIDGTFPMRVDSDFIYIKDGAWTCILMDLS